MLSGNPMPNTFYAKQAEYSAYWLAKPITERLSEYLLPLLVSPFLALLPGALSWLVKSLRSWNWGALAGVLWFFGYVAIYFMRLPAYQHGRYIMPALPILYLWGLLGFLQIVNSSGFNTFVANLWKMFAVALSVAFVYLGARTYAMDVAFIESEMITTAKWTAQNLPSEAVLAVHDIGALGYYDRHKLIDLAGLVSPDVVPFIRDQSKLAEYLDRQHANYLVTFPAFYPDLVSTLEPVFSTGGSYAPIMGGENMKVYRWK